MAAQNERVLSRAKVAAAWQSAWGTPAATSLVRYQHAANMSWSPGHTLLKNRGATGSQYQKVEHTRLVCLEPTVNLSFYLSKSLASLWLEAIRRGAPTTATANIVERVSVTQASAWALTGVRPGFNTLLGDSAARLAVLYGRLDDTTTGGSTYVRLFRDSGRTLLVAASAAVADGALPTTATPIVAANNSGLSGTVNLSAAPTGDLDFILDVNKMTFADSDVFERFFTVFGDDGFYLYTIPDCVVESWKISGSERGTLLVELSIRGSYVTEAATALTHALEDESSFAFKDCVILADYSVTSETLSPRSFELSGNTRIDVLIGPNDRPQTFVADGVDAVQASMTFKSNDKDEVLFARGLADTPDSLSFVATFGSCILTMNMPTGKWTEWSKGGVTENNIADVSFVYEAMDQIGSTDVMTCTLETS